MKRVVIIAGLPGSGKSNYIGQYIKNKGGFWYIVDDYNNDMLAFTKERIDLDHNVVISSIDFCKPGVISALKEELESAFTDIDIDVVYFENNMRKCIVNVIERSKERGDRFSLTNIGSTILVGDIDPLTGEAGIESDIRTIFDLWRNYYVDTTKEVIPVYSKE